MNTKDKEVTKNDNIYLVKENRKLRDEIYWLKKEVYFYKNPQICYLRLATQVIYES